MNRYTFKPTLNVEIFKNVTMPETAYVLGLLWADGWIQNTNDFSINIKLISEDFQYLEWIFDKLGIWKKYRYNPKGRKPTTQLRTSGKDAVDYLISIGYKNKSFDSAKTVIDTIPNNLKHYWWRGYLDGDGYISSKHPYRLMFCSGYNQDWSFLPIEYNFKIIRQIGKTGHKHSKAFICSKKLINQFGNFIYKNYEIDNIGLYRKFNAYKCYCIVDNN